MLKEEIERRFTRRQKTGDSTVDAYLDILWGQTKIHAQKIIDLTVPGREQSASITALEESLFWAEQEILRRYLR